MNETALAPLDATAITTETHTTLDQVRALTVTDTATYAIAGDRITGLRALSKSIEAFFDPHVKRAHEAWKALTTDRKALVDPIEAQVTRLGREMANFAAEQERLARVQREEDHRRAQEQERAAALAEAAGMEGAGMPDEAMAVVDGLLASVPVTAPLVPSVPKVDGVSYRDEWRHEVTDAKLVPREYLMVNEPAIAKVVAATQGAVQIPGVRTFIVKVPMVRGRR